jgi:hypothetical protein
VFRLPMVIFEPPLPPEDPMKCIAESMYNAFRANIGGKATISRQTLPEWEVLPLPDQIAWQAAAQHARLCFDAPVPYRPFIYPDPNIWAGWRP